MKMSAFFDAQNQKFGGENPMREYKVNITETVLRHIWVLADDPQDAIEIAEQTYSSEETIDVSFDVEPVEYREYPDCDASNNDEQ